MLALDKLEYPVFLDSSGNDSARFDILSALPVAHIKIEDGVVSVSDPEITVQPTDIFNGIRALRDKYLLDAELSVSAEPDQPFQGGLLGFLGYPSLLGMSGMQINDAFIGVYHWAVVIDHLKQSTQLIFHPRCLSSTASFITDLLATMDKVADPDSFALESNFSKDLSRADYDGAFNQVKDYISAGDCYQVNLTQQFNAHCSGSPLAAYLRLRNATHAPFSAYLNWGTSAVLSLSPERFVQVEDKAVLTQPIKGTRPRGNNPAQDQNLAEELQASEKDRAENLMIVDLLRNDIGRVCKTGSITVNQLFELQSFSNVHHLVSSVSGELEDGSDALDLLQSCFPGGSITGAPKLRAMKIIEQIEQSPRRAYCGTIFYVSANGDMDSNITIRTLFWQQDHLQCWAGGGIVADSDVDAEYEECLHKIDNIIKELQN